MWGHICTLFWQKHQYYQTGIALKELPVWKHWYFSFSPHATGELFEELKKGREEPDPAKAAGVTVDAADEFNTEKYNPTIMDFLSKLPGITTKNIFALMNRLENMQDLLDQSLEDLTEILGHSSNAKDLYNCLHESLCPQDEQQSSNNKAKLKGSRFKSEKSKVKTWIDKVTNRQNLFRIIRSLWLIVQKVNLL